MLTADRILRILGDGKWHHISEIVPDHPETESDYEIVLGFLREYGFIDMSEDEQKIKLSVPMLSFINRIQQIEIQEGLGDEGLNRAIRVKKFESPLGRSEES